MSESDENTSRRGRPRSDRVHRAILQAALRLLREAGWSGFTVEGVAQRAGVGKAAIYRRWTSREAVLAAAVAAVVSEITIPDSGSAREDLLELMRQAVSLYRGDAGRMMPGLASAMAEHAEVATAVRVGFLGTRRAALMEVVDRGIARGELRPDIDRELTLDFLGGPLFYRLLITGGDLDDDLTEGTVDILLRGIGRTAETRT